MLYSWCVYVDETVKKHFPILLRAIPIGLKSRFSLESGKLLNDNTEQQRVALSVDLPRKCRGVVDLDRWKASELRQLLLYIGPVVLRDILHPDVYECFMLFTFFHNTTPIYQLTFPRFLCQNLLLFLAPSELGHLKHYIHGSKPPAVQLYRRQVGRVGLDAVEREIFLDDVGLRLRPSVCSWGCRFLKNLPDNCILFDGQPAVIVDFSTDINEYQIFKTVLTFYTHALISTDVLVFQCSDLQNTRLFASVDRISCKCLSFSRKVIRIYIPILRTLIDYTLTTGTQPAVIVDFSTDINEYQIFKTVLTFYTHALISTDVLVFQCSDLQNTRLFASVDRISCKCLSFSRKVIRIYIPILRTLIDYRARTRCFGIAASSCSVKNVLDSFPDAMGAQQEAFDSEEQNDERLLRQSMRKQYVYQSYYNGCSTKKRLSSDFTDGSDHDSSGDSTLCANIVISSPTPKRLCTNPTAIISSIIPVQDAAPVLGDAPMTCGTYGLFHHHYLESISSSTYKTLSAVGDPEPHSSTPILRTNCPNSKASVISPDLANLILNATSEKFPNTNLRQIKEIAYRWLENERQKVRKRLQRATKSDK
ncbi:LOW QUALITY PROTEIN: hypothetical protein T265_14310 [Opisthorchis viverrini]|uniref:Uncharacterized protein n=1 Tax=Opisthorchis viverrini TaxID=6198 RepID=A0A074ZCP6_OPIVI|nr:LOW QUALITY PROTEIN: hypothetical protein T265_14310 [Opisthorchis viverrini]KER24943.1 LOW QUALITY PROTEIN: hypothetical protein T265_14310 [Opisthorchis viverrini]